VSELRTRSADAERLAERFDDMWSELERIGGRGDGGYDRFAWTDEDVALRQWFRKTADERGMAVEQDRNGNLWAWWGNGRSGAIVTGSHLDSVPGGGAFDGPLGVVGGFLAIDELRARAESPARPVAVVVFTEEEGARFGVACLGSRLMTGCLDPAHAGELKDAAGVTLAEAMQTRGADPSAIGADEDRVSAIAAYVELHIEQGRRLVDLGAPVGMASEIWPHGRWSLCFDGEPNHAGTAMLFDRRDPMLPFAATVAAARAMAASRGGLATVGRVDVRPNATNGVAARVRTWLDARAPDQPSLEAIVDGVHAQAERAALEHGVSLTFASESLTTAVAFDASLRERMSRVLGAIPAIPTGAGHDAGILAKQIPAAMLFVRNPTGVSHSPSERATREDCMAGIHALSSVLSDLVWG
jgi:beta-ureidopropionase / N-carbamoyl-L-amino-acid hydrolase